MQGRASARLPYGVRRDASNSKMFSAILRWPAGKKLRGVVRLGAPSAISARDTAMPTYVGMFPSALAARAGLEAYVRSLGDADVLQAFLAYASTLRSWIRCALRPRKAGTRCIAFRVLLLSTRWNQP